MPAFEWQLGGNSKPLGNVSIKSNGKASKELKMDSDGLLIESSRQFDDILVGELND